jgi:hypothetical protein
LVAQSEMLSTAQAEALLGCLPESLAIEGLEIAFSTRLHGHTLAALYAKTLGLSPIVILCRPISPDNSRKTSQEESDGIVVGATISQTISPPNNEQVRGDGKHSRVFLIGADCDRTHNKLVQSVVLDWAANHDSSLLKRALSSERDNQSDQDAAFISALSQFCMARNTSLSFGASLKHGTACLYMDDSLSTITLGASDTFGNTKPIGLSSEVNVSNEKRMILQDVEVFCGRSSMRKATAEGRFVHQASVVRDIEADER